VAKINPEKLITNLKVTTRLEDKLNLSYDLPVDFSEGEEIVIVRRKDSFPVELKNPSFEDRYTDVAQVEVFRGHPIYCSHMTVGDGKLTLATDNSFQPSFVTEFSIDNKLTGRLVRDSNGQVFRIINNTEGSLSYSNVSKNSKNQIEPQEGEFVILADFSATDSKVVITDLLTDSLTLTVDSNTFTVGEKISINNTVSIYYNVDWTSGATTLETAQNIQRAILGTGIGYTVELYDSTLLIEKSDEEILSITTDASSLLINDYAVSGNKIFVPDNTFTKNELTNLVVQFGISTYFVKRNLGKQIELYNPNLGNSDLSNQAFAVLPKFNNSFPAGLEDNHKNYLEILLKNGTGLEQDQHYYYTVFTTPIRSSEVVRNEITAGGNDPANYTVDKLGTHVQRVFFENVIYDNSTDYTFDSVTGTITYSDVVDLSSVQLGDLFADSDGRRETITDISQISSSILKISTGLSISTVITEPIHGSVTRAEVPVNLSAALVNDVFKDFAGNSFRIIGTFNQPTGGLTNPPSHSIDVEQGLTDQVVLLNTFLIPYTYNPSTRIIQYGERTVSLNKLLSSFSYNSVSGLINYSGTTIDLTDVQIGHFLQDGSGVLFEINGVNHQTQELLLAPLLSVDNTVVTNRDGSIIEQVGFKDVEGNLLVDLSPVEPEDLFKTNSKAVIEIEEVNSELGQLVLISGILDISLVIETQFDGSIIRKGSVVSVGEITSTNQGSIRRFGSVYESEFSYLSSPLSTQVFSLNSQDRGLPNYMYGLYPTAFNSLDSNGDLEAITTVFAKELNEFFSIITLTEPYNSEILNPEALTNGSQALGIPSPNEVLGIDTRRRVMRDLKNAFKLKGNREGIAKFIKIITTWDITNGTGDLKEAIVDSSPETTSIRFYSAPLGDQNTRYVDTLDVQSPPAGRFYKPVGGISLPGFFDFIEIIIALPNVALYLGMSSDLTRNGATTTIQDDSASYGEDNSLIGAFLIPNEANPGDFLEIVSNTSNTITVQGVIPEEVLGAEYVVLSPLNLNRFTTISTLITEFLPYNGLPVFNFTITE